MAQEVEQHGHRQHQADDAGLAQLQQGAGDVFALVVDQGDLDALELGVLADAVDFRQRRAGDVDEVGVALLEHVDADGRPALEAAAVVHPAGLEAHVGDLLEAQAVRADHQLAQFADVAQLADRLHAKAAFAVLDGARGHREVDRLQRAGQLVEAQAVRGQAVRVDGDLDLARGRAGDVDAGDAGQALELALELEVYQVVLVRQVALAGQAHAQDRLVAGRELDDLVALEVVRQVVADGVDALAGLGGQHLDVAVPVRELDPDAAAVGAAERIDVLDALQGRQRLLDGPHQTALDFVRGRARVRKFDRQERRVELGELFQRQPERGDQADDQHRHEEHDRRHRTAQAEFGDAHACASPGASTTIGRERSTKLSSLRRSISR